MGGEAAAKNSGGRPPSLSGYFRDKCVKNERTLLHLSQVVGGVRLRLVPSCQGRKSVLLCQGLRDNFGDREFPTFAVQCAVGRRKINSNNSVFRTQAWHLMEVLGIFSIWCNDVL